MKKILVFLISILVAIGNISADSSVTLVPSDSTNYAEASVSMNLDLTDNGNFNRVIIGFSNSPVTSFESIVATGVDEYTLAKDEEGIAGNSDTPLYVFYQIQSAQQLKVSLYTTGPLMNEGETDNINFSVTGTEVAGKEDSSVSKKKDFINTASNTGCNKPAEDVFVYVHKPAERVGKAGSYELEITTTESYLEHEMDSYSSDLIVQILVGN